MVNKLLSYDNNTWNENYVEHIDSDRKREEETEREEYVRERKI